MKNALKTVTAIAVLLAAWGLAEAGQIFTPVLYIDTDFEAFFCAAANVGSTPIIVKVEFVRFDGTVPCSFEFNPIQPGHHTGIACFEEGNGQCKFSTPPYNVAGSIPSVRANICAIVTEGVSARVCADAR